MIHRVNETSVRWEYVHRAAHAENSFVALDVHGVGNDEGMVALCNPHAVVPHILALQTLYLKRSCCMQVHATPRGDSRDLFQNASEERVA